MNDICSDLQFRPETQNDFDNGYIPTLDFQLKLHDFKDTSNMHAGR